MSFNFPSLQIMRVALLLAFAVTWLPMVRAQDAAVVNEQPPLFCLLNLVKAKSPLKVKLGNEPVGIGEMPYGFYTGIVNWYPTVPVTLEAAGFESDEVPLPESNKGEGTVPLFVAYDTKKPLSPGGEPVAMIEHIKVPHATSRTGNYLDVINLSAKETLDAEADKQKLSLPKGKRVRVSSRAAAAFRVSPDGPEITMGVAEDGAQSQALAIIYSREDGSLDYVVAPEAMVVR